MSRDQWVEIVVKRLDVSGELQRLLLFAYPMALPVSALPDDALERLTDRSP